MHPYFFSENRNRMVARTVSLQESDKPKIYEVEYDLYSEVVRISPVFGKELYLQVQDGTIRAPKDDALDTRDACKLFVGGI